MIVVGLAFVLLGSALMAKADPAWCEPQGAIFIVTGAAFIAAWMWGRRPTT